MGLSVQTERAEPGGRQQHGGVLPACRQGAHSTDRMIHEQKDNPIKIHRQAFKFRPFLTLSIGTYYWG